MTYPQHMLEQIAFIKEIDKLKYIQRRTKLVNSDRRENDAEHSWYLAMMVLVLAEHANEPVDVLKVLKMVLVHDIVEIDAGDTFMYDAQRDHMNTVNERAAAERIFGMLPAEQSAAFIAIWEEFEAGITAEARFARAMDRLEPLLQNTSNTGGTWKGYGVKYAAVHHKKSAIKEGSRAIRGYAEELLEDAVEKGILRQ